MDKKPKILQTISFREEDAVKELHIDFCIRSDFLNKEILSKELGITPTRVWNKGEEYLGKTRDVVTKEIVTVKRKRPWGIWGLDTKNSVSSKTVEDHARYLIDLLEPHKNQLKKYLLDKDNYSVRFFIWWEPYDGHGSYEISSETLIRMAELSHHIEFLCIYTEGKETAKPTRKKKA